MMFEDDRGRVMELWQANHLTSDYVIDQIEDYIIAKTKARIYKEIV